MPRHDQSTTTVVPGMPERPSSLIEFIGRTLVLPFIPERTDDIPCRDAVGVVRDETQQEGAVLSQIVVNELAHGLVLAVDSFVLPEPVFNELEAVVALQRTR